MTSTLIEQAASSAQQQAGWQRRGTRKTGFAGRFLRGVTALALITCAVLGGSAGSAAFAEDDDDPALEQDLTGEQQGTGRVVISSGHVDFGPVLLPGDGGAQEARVQIHDDSGAVSYWRNLEDVVLQVSDAAKLEVPDNAAYSFVQADPGETVWVLPQTEQPGVVWAGWNTQQETLLQQASRGVTLSVLGVQGPGDVAVYLQDGNFGEPQALWHTGADFPQQMWIELNTHTHANWVFTKPGVYLVTMLFDITLNTGETARAQGTLRFAVGDETDAEAAFTAAVDESKLASADAEPVDAVGAAEDAAAGNSFEIVVWVVVGVVGVALLIAVVLVLIASARAKRRAADPQTSESAAAAATGVGPAADPADTSLARAAADD